MVVKTGHQKQKIVLYTKNLGWVYVLRKGLRSFCSTSGTRRVILVTNPLIDHEREKNDWIVITTNGTYGHSYHRCCVRVPKSWWGRLNFLSDIFNLLITSNLWFSNFLVSSNPLSMYPDFLRNNIKEKDHHNL